MATITDLQYYSIFFLLWLISTLILQFIFKKRSTKPPTNLCLPPSPPALPVIGHLHLFSPYINKCFNTLSSKYGPLLNLRFGSFGIILVSSASIAREIFTNDINFASRPVYIFEDSILFGHSGIINAPYGEYWRFMKKLCVTELLSTRQIERSSSVRREELTRFLYKLVEKGYKNEIVDVGGELMKLTNNATCRMVMSTRCSKENGDAERIRGLVTGSFVLAAKLCIANALGPLKKLGYWVFGKEIADVITGYDELLERVLKEHEERAKIDSSEREYKDLMDILLEVYQDNNAPVRITRAQMKAFILDLFIAGTSTSADAMEWAMAELINHPNVFKKVREEIESVLGRTRLVEESDIPSLPYLQAVVKETLRLHPPGPSTARLCRKNCKIGGFDIPEKSTIAINLYAIMRDSDSWENPNEFFPERFLVFSQEQDNMDNIQNEMKGQNFNFVPFGAGRRGCPGSNLAFILMNTAVAAMVQCFDWKVDGDGDGAKVNMEAGIGVSLHMAHPLRCLPVVHFNPFAS